MALPTPPPTMAAFLTPSRCVGRPSGPTNRKWRRLPRAGRAASWSGDDLEYNSNGSARRVRIRDGKGYALAELVDPEDDELTASAFFATSGGSIYMSVTVSFKRRLVTIRNIESITSSYIAKSLFAEENLRENGGSRTASAPAALCSIAEVLY
jgi:hypothetical protein